MRRGDDAVGAFLLQSGQTAQRLVGDVLPQAVLADLGAAQFDVLDQRALLVEHVEDHGVLRQNLAQLVIGAAHRPARAGGHGHAPLQQIVDAGAPAHGELAAGVFGDVAAEGAGPGAGGIGGKDQAMFGGVLHRLFGDDSGFGFHDLGGDGAAVVEVKLALADGANAVELFGVDHDAAGAQAAPRRR